MVRRNYTTEFQPVIGFNGKTIGHSDGHTFTKKIKGSKHILKKPPAIAIDAEAFDREIASTCQKIEVYDSESNRLYTSTTENFNHHKGTIDRGFGKQYFLPFHRWDSDTPEAPAKVTFPIDITPIVSPQMAFFINGMPL